MSICSEIPVAVEFLICCRGRLTNHLAELVWFKTDLRRRGN